MVMLTMTFGDP